MHKVLKKVTKERKKIVERASRLRQKDFEKFSPLLQDTCLYKDYATLGNLLLIVRRCTMLYMAMYVLKRQWLQIQVFMALNLVSVIYTITVRPFESSLLNNLNIANEVIGLLATYLLLPL